MFSFSLFVSFFLVALNKDEDIEESVIEKPSAPEPEVS